MFALDLFNTDHERRLAEGAVDKLEQRRIDDLAMKMDELVARARKVNTPEAKAALVKEFQKCKDERDSYFKIKDECMGYGTLVGETEEDEEEWYDANGRPSEYGCYDAGGHYHPDREQDMDAGYDAYKERQWTDESGGIGQDLVTPQQRVQQSTPQKQTPAGKVVDTAKQAVRWLAGKGGPGKEGPTYESELDEAFGPVGSKALMNGNLATFMKARQSKTPVTLEIGSEQFRLTPTMMDAMAKKYNDDKAASDADPANKDTKLIAVNNYRAFGYPQLMRAFIDGVATPEPTPPSNVPGEQLPMFEKKSGQKKKYSDPVVSREIQKARAAYPSASSDIEALVKRELETDNKQDLAIANLDAENKTLAQRIDSFGPNSTQATPIAAPKATAGAVATPAIPSIPTAMPPATAPEMPATIPAAGIEPTKEPATKEKTKTSTAKEPVKAEPEKIKKTATKKSKKLSYRPARTRIQQPTRAALPDPNTIDIDAWEVPTIDIPDELSPGEPSDVAVAKAANDSKVIAKAAESVEKPTGIGQMVKDIGQGKELQQDPAYRSQVRRTQQQVAQRQQNINQQKAGYGDDADDFGDIPDINESHMSELDVMRQDLERMNERQFMTAYGISKAAFQQRYRALLKPALDEARLAVGDPVVVTAPNEFEGKTGEIYDFSPSGTFVIVDLYNHGKHSMHLSDVAYNDYADQEETDDWYDDADEFGKPGSEFFPEGWKGGVAGGVAGATGGEVLGSKAGEALGKAIGGHIGAGAVPAPLSSLGSKAGEAIGGIVGSKLGAVAGALAGGAGGAAIGDKLGDEVDEGYQDFTKKEPYEVCLAGKCVKTFDYYEDARRFHDNWKKKLYREGNKAKADKITLNPVLDEGWKSALGGAALAGAMALGGAGTAQAQSSGPSVVNPTAVIQQIQSGKIQNQNDLMSALGNASNKQAVWKVLQNTAGMQGSNDVNSIIGAIGHRNMAGSQAQTVNQPPTAKSINQPQSRSVVMNPRDDFEEAANPAQQAAIAVAMKKAGKKPKSLNEYIVRSGDDIDSVLSLNLFADLLGQGNLSDYDEEFANSAKWQAVVAKWAPKAEYLQREIAKYQNTGRKLRDAEADALDATAYDGSDAYNNADMAAQYLPKVYNKQAAAIVRLLKDGYANPPAGLHEDSAMTQQQWMQSMKQQYPNVKFAQNKTTMQIFAMVPGKGKVGEFDPRQQVTELEAADIVNPNAQTSTPPRRAYSIVLDGRAGKPGGNRYRAVNAWNALAMVFPQDYPGESAQYKVAEVAKKGSAIVKTGISSEDIAETYVAKLSKFVPAEHWRIVGGELEEGTVGEGSWIVYNSETKQIKKRFKTHTAGKSYAKTHGLGFASSEYYFDRVKDQQPVAETVTDVRAEMARVYRKLAPRIERHKDSFLAGQLYDELENIAELHGAEAEFKRMMAGARNRAHMDYDTNPGGFQNWFWYLPFEDETIKEENSTDSEAVEIALIRRVLVAHTNLIMEFGLDKVTQAIEEVAYNVGDVDEIGSSDVSGWIHQVKQILGVE